MAAIDKNEVLLALQTRMAGQLESLTASQQAVQSGAVHPEARQEHPKDTRSIEAGYLARGLAERVEMLRDAVRMLVLMRPRAFGPEDVAASGALVTLVRDDGSEDLYLLAPCGGGERIESSGVEVLVLTPRSPLGSAIAGKRCGDTVSVELPSGTVRAQIERID